MMWLVYRLSFLLSRSVGPKSLGWKGHRWGDDRLHELSDAVGVMIRKKTWKLDRQKDRGIGRRGRTCSRAYDVLLHGGPRTNVCSVTRNSPG
ncbi:hypothetical protein EDD36DRAFT_436262 [Exophiala viscosa]|uniref:Secreted protein n=1 Tax=Exophiala viscosa TaxID=2486360 RepID=A0AAN6E0U2_9EURO|nr:hypothetical protein EDD36DRAFT_436262 [Exophiala viscosa]